MKLQQMDDELAISAITFYLTGPAKTWFQGLPHLAKDNIRAIMKLLEIRFEQSDEDDLLTNQLRTENVKEYIDLITVKAQEQNIPESLLLKIVKRGFQQSLQPFIIQRNPKTMEELKEAAIIAKR
jgi:hypothetical protein